MNNKPPRRTLYSGKDEWVKSSASEWIDWSENLIDRRALEASLSAQWDEFIQPHINSGQIKLTSKG